MGRRSRADAEQRTLDHLRIRGASLRAIGSVLALTAISSLVHAQSAPTVAGVVQEGLRRQAERDKAQQDASAVHDDTLHAAPPRSGVPDIPDEKPCFVIREIVFAGKDAQRFSWLSTSTDAFLGRCIGTRGVGRIAEYLDAQLVEQGYATSRVGIGPQNLSDGQLSFNLLAGRIQDVRMVDAQTKKADTRWGTWINAFPTTDGRLLNARDLEQGVEQMKRLPSQNVTTTLAPGAAPDTSILTIERQPGGLKDRVHGGIALDNSGSAPLGRAQLSANVALDNLLGFNDIVGLSFNGNAENPAADHRSQSASVNYGIPFGYSTFTANFSHSRFAQNVALTTTQVLSSGETDTADLKWEHVAWRTSATKTGLFVDLSTRSARSFLDDAELTAQQRQTTSLESGLTFKELFEGNASIDVSASYKRGASLIGAHDDLPSEAGVTLRPRIRFLNVNLSVPFKQPAVDGRAERSWQYSLSYHGQFTHDASTSIDQISIGNRGTVRGFDGDSVLLAESGWYLRNELSTPIAIPGTESSLYFGVDIGRVWGPSDGNLLGHFLAGAAVGVRSKWKAMQFDAAFAVPILMPDGFKTQRGTAYLSGMYTF